MMTRLEMITLTMKNNTLERDQKLQEIEDLQEEYQDLLDEKRSLEAEADRRQCNREAANSVFKPCKELKKVHWERN